MLDGMKTRDVVVRSVLRGRTPAALALALRTSHRAAAMVW